VEESRWLILISDRDAFLGEKPTLGIFLSPLPLVKNYLTSTPLSFALTRAREMSLSVKKYMATNISDFARLIS